MSCACPAMKLASEKFVARADELESLTEGSTKPIWFQPKFTRLWARRDAKATKVPRLPQAGTYCQA